MKATRRRSAGGLPVRRKATAARGFMCGCGGSKSVSVFNPSANSPVATPTTTRSTSTTTTSLPAASSFRVDDTDANTSAADTPSVDALLRQLHELERGVLALGVQADGAHGHDTGRTRPRHRRSVSDCHGRGVGRLDEESVAVVKESADPLGDFRRSMLQMIVENEIVSAAELRELLHRFLSLNSPRHHHLILRAFAEIWEEVFAGHDWTTNPLAHKNSYTDVHTLPLTSETFLSA